MMQELREVFEKMKEKSHRVMWIVTGILTMVSILVIYVTNREIPFMMDDLWYSTVLSEDAGTPLSSFADIVKSQIWHYFNWGGRSMTHGILQLTLLAGEPAADLLNVVIVILLAGMVCLVSGYRTLPAFFAAVAMTLGLNANWRMSMFWQSGAANYLYITVFILAFLYCYLRELPEDGSCIPWKQSVDKAPAKKGETEAFSAPRDLFGIVLWIVPLGIITGWSNENMGPTAWIISFLIIFFLRKEGRKIKVWMILGNLACLLGSFLCIAAPGNFVRMSEAEGEYGVLWRFFLRCYAEAKAALEYLFPTLFVLGAVWFVGKCVLKLKLGRRNVLLLFGALISWGAFILSPHFPDRATFGTMMLCICFILSLVKRILQHRLDLAWPLWSGAVFIWLRGMYFCGEWLSLMWGWIK